MSEAVDQVVALLKDKDYASVIDHLLADEQLVQQIVKSKSDAVNAEVVPFILTVRAHATSLFSDSSHFSFRTNPPRMQKHWLSFVTISPSSIPLLRYLLHIPIKGDLMLIRAPMHTPFSCIC